MDRIVNGKEIGLPVYPGSRLREDSKESAQTRLGLWISDKGFRLVAVKYEALSKFGTVLQCPGGAATASGLTSKDYETNAGDVDLMAGSEEKRRIVGVEAPAHGRTRFELVYLRTKGVDVH